VPKEELLASTSNKENMGRTATIPVPSKPKDSEIDEAVVKAIVVEAETSSKISESQSEQANLLPNLPLVQKEGESKSGEQQTTSANAAGLRIQLGAYRSAEAAESDWARLSAREQSLLGSLDHVIVRADLGERGIYYRLQTGPLNGLRAARTMCNKLKERELGCLVVRPAVR